MHTSQAAQSVTPRTVIVEAQMIVTSLPLNSFQLGRKDRDLFAEYTTLEDCHASHDMERNDIEMLDSHGHNSAEVSTEHCNTSDDASLPEIVSSSGASTPNDANTVLSDIGNDAANTRDTKVHPFQGDPAPDYFRMGSFQSPNRNPATEPITSEMPNYNSCRHYSLEDGHDAFPSCTYGSSLPYYSCSASISPSLPSSNHSSPAVHELIWPEGSPQTIYAQCVQRLSHLCHSIYRHLPSIVQLGDSFFQEDSVPFVKSFCRRWNQTDLCYPTPSNVADDDLRMKGLLTGFYHAEAFRRHSVVDRLKLRFLRILLYHNFEELRIDIDNKLVKYRLLPNGQDVASAATDKILGEFDRAYKDSGDKRTSEQR